MVKESCHEYIFFTGEGSTLSPTGEEIENMQILGLAKGYSETSALRRLLEDNPWIENAGYTPSKIYYREVLSMEKGNSL